MSYKAGPGKPFGTREVPSEAKLASSRANASSPQAKTRQITPEERAQINEAKRLFVSAFSGSPEELGTTKGGLQRLSIAQRMFDLATDPETPFESFLSVSNFIGQRIMPVTSRHQIKAEGMKLPVIVIREGATDAPHVAHGEPRGDAVGNGTAH